MAKVSSEAATFLLVVISFATVDELAGANISVTIVMKHFRKVTPTRHTCEKT